MVQIVWKHNREEDGVGGAQPHCEQAEWKVTDWWSRKPWISRGFEPPQRLRHCEGLLVSIGKEENLLQRTKRICSIFATLLWIYNGGFLN